MHESEPQKIARELELAIFKGELKPHSRFPSERTLAERYRVSRPVVREAITHLTQLGLVKSVPKSGTFVTDYQSAASLELLVHIMQTTEEIDSTIILSLLRTRRMIAPFVAFEVAKVISAEDLRAMQQAGQKLIASLNNPEAVSEADFNFHFSLFEIMNDLITKLIYNAVKPIYRHYTDYYYQLDGTKAATTTFVNELLDALAKHDAPTARQVMDDAVLYAENRLITSLKLTEQERSINLRTG